MATTVERPNKIDERTPAAGGGSGQGGFFTEDGNLHLVLDRRSPHPSSTAVYVALAGIGMIFAALTSALVVRKGGSTDWKSFTLPSILYVNTLVLLASGFVLEVGRRAVGKFMTAPDRQHAKPTFWFYLTLGLGLLFVAGQYVAWLQLRREGVVSRDEPEQFFLLRAYGHACPARAGWTWRTGAHHHQAAPPHLTEEHVECSFAILAFHGCPVDLSVVFALVHYLTGRCRSEKLERG